MSFGNTIFLSSYFFLQLEAMPNDFWISYQPWRGIIFKRGVQPIEGKGGPGEFQNEWPNKKA